MQVHKRLLTHADSVSITAVQGIISVDFAKQPTFVKCEELLAKQFIG